MGIARDDFPAVTTRYSLMRRLATATAPAARPVRLAQPAAPWFRGWGLVGVACFVALTATGLLGVIELWRSFSHGDPALLRWSKVDESWSDCYRDLVTLKPPKSDCVHSGSESIEPPPFAWVRPHVAVYSAVAPPHPPPTLRDLSDQGQAQAIGFLEKDAGLKGRAWADLHDALNDTAIGVGERDPFRFDRVLVANVAKGLDWTPGDRMVWTRVLIQPINFRLAGYSVAATDNETQKVTSIESTNSRKFSTDISATIPGMEGPKVSLDPSVEHTVRTNTDVNAQYEKLGVDIMPGFLRIMRESETGGDAVGNTKVSLTAVTDPVMIQKRYPDDTSSRQIAEDPIVLLVTATNFDGDGGVSGEGATGGKKPAITVLPQVPVPHCALRARVWMLYEQRHILSGGESYAEGKQTVTLAHDAEDKQDVDIISADEVSPAVWSLRVCTDPKCVEGLPLRATVLPGARSSQSAPPWRKVVFTDYAVAIRLAHWLRTHQTSSPPNSSYKFDYPGGDDRTYASLVPFKVSGDDCRPVQTEQTAGR